MHLIRYLNNKRIKQLLLAMAVSVVLAGLTWRQSTAVELITSAAPSALVYQSDQGYEQLSQLATAQRLLAEDQQDPSRAVSLARLSLAMYQTTGHRRFIGMAKSALSPWWQQPRPELNVWLLRSRLQQAEHHFATAAAELLELNRHYPGTIEAMLLEADAWRRAGHIDRAKRACIAITFAGRPDLSRYCAAELLLSQGNSQQAKQVLAAVISTAVQLPISERNWAYAIYADSLVAVGELDRAVTLLARVEASGQASLANTMAYADVLLALSQWQAVVELLADKPPITAVMLRQLKAHKQLGSPHFYELKAELDQRLAVIARSDDAELHLRERALYSLWISDDLSRALELARHNWQLQKGWEDTELLLKLADRLNDRHTIAEVQQWRQQLL